MFPALTDLRREFCAHGRQQASFTLPPNGCGLRDPVGDAVVGLVVHGLVSEMRPLRGLCSLAVFASQLVRAAPLRDTSAYIPLVSLGLLILRGPVAVESWTQGRSRGGARELVRRCRVVGRAVVALLSVFSLSFSLFRPSFCCFLSE